MPLTSFFHHPIRGIGANLLFVSVLVSLLCATWFLLAASLSPHIHFNPPPVRFAKPPISNISDSFFSSDLFSPSDTTLPNVPPGFTIVDVDGDSSIEFAIAAWLMRTSDTPSIVQITLIFNIALLSAQYNMWSASIRRQKKLLHSVLSVLHASSLVSWALASFQWPRLLDHLAPWMSEIWLSAVLHASALAGVFLYSLVCWSLSLHLLSDQTEIDSLNAPVAQAGVLSWSFLVKVFRAIAALAMQPRVQQLFRSIFLLFTISFLSSAPLSALWPSVTLNEFFGPELAPFNLFISFMAAVAMYTLYNLRSAMLAARDEWLALGWSARDMTYARWIASATVWWLLGACMLRGVTIVVNLIVCRQTSSTLCSSWFDDWFVPAEWFGQADQFVPLLLRSLLSPSGVYLVDLLFRLLLLSISTSSDFLALDGLRLIDVQRRLAHVTEKLDSSELSKGVSSPPNAGFASPPTSLVGAPTPAAIMDSLRDVHSFVRDFLSDAAGLQTLMPSSNAADAEERGRQRAFLQSVTLHLRAPVQSVIAMAKMMLQHAIAPPVTNSTSGVSNGDVLQIRAALICAQNLLETLDNLISFCEISDHVAPSPVKPTIPELISMGPLTNLRESLDQVLDTLGIRLSDKSIELLVLWEDPLVLPNRKVHLDHEKYTAILINLLTNAVQHSPTGSDLLVRISLRLQSPASIIGDLETCTLAIEIEDFGAGIAPEKIERVFEPFYSVTKRLKQQSTGSAVSDSDNEGASSPSSRKRATEASDSDATPTIKSRALPARRGDSNMYFDGFCTSPSLTTGRRPRQKHASLRAPARLGAGLGLYLSRSLAQQMYGSLACQSRVRTGSIFRLELPVASVRLPAPVVSLASLVQRTPEPSQSSRLSCPPSPTESFTMSPRGSPPPLPSRSSSLGVPASPYSPRPASPLTTLRSPTQRHADIVVSFDLSGRRSSIAPVIAAPPLEGLVVFMCVRSANLTRLLSSALTSAGVILSKINIVEQPANARTNKPAVATPALDLSTAGVMTSRYVQATQSGSAEKDGSKFAFVVAPPINRPAAGGRVLGSVLLMDHDLLTDASFEQLGALANSLETSARQNSLPSLRTLCSLVGAYEYPNPSSDKKASVADRRLAACLGALGIDRKPSKFGRDDTLLPFIFFNRPMRIAALVAQLQTTVEQLKKSQSAAPRTMLSAFALSNLNVAITRPTEPAQRVNAGVAGVAGSVPIVPVVFGSPLTPATSWVSRQVPGMGAPPAPVVHHRALPGKFAETSNSAFSALFAAASSHK